MTEYLNIWTLIRASGFIAFFLVTVSLSLGIGSSLSMMKKHKGLLQNLHQTSGWYGLLTIIFHIVLILEDQYVHYSLQEVLIPFAAKNEPLESALGTLSFYLFFLVIVSSDFFIKKLGIKRWKKLHLAVLPAWFLMVFHGLAIGTDSREPWALFIYACGSSLIIVLSLIRYMNALAIHRNPNRKTVNK